MCVCVPVGVCVCVSECVGKCVHTSSSHRQAGRVLSAAPCQIPNISGPMWVLLPLDVESSLVAQPWCCELTWMYDDRVASRFGDYRKDDPTSFTLQSQLEYLPQFMFNLRRSQFVQVNSNSSGVAHAAESLADTLICLDDMACIHDTLHFRAWAVLLFQAVALQMVWY